jgi:hypothetical protein
MVILTNNSAHFITYNDTGGFTLQITIDVKSWHLL